MQITETKTEETLRICNLAMDFYNIPKHRREAFEKGFHDTDGTLLMAIAYALHRSRIKYNIDKITSFVSQHEDLTHWKDILFSN